MSKVLIAGGGGFIGGWLVRRLLDEGHSVRAVDIKPLDKWWQLFPGPESVVGDLRLSRVCVAACEDVDHVYNLACSMGGIGHIETHMAECALSTLINTNLLRAALYCGVQRYFFSSSACVYPAHKQDRPNLPALKESDAYPAQPEKGYGEEKLFAERMCELFMTDFGLDVRVARFHNVMGPFGDWIGGKEKAPAAMCRKVAEAKLFGKREIEVWGDGTRQRSYMWIDDCIEGIRRIMRSDVREPINLGTSEMVTVNELIGIVEEAAGIRVKRQYNTTKCQGVYGRNSDNTIILERLGWEPTTKLRNGIARLYPWIEEQVEKQG